MKNCSTCDLELSLFDKKIKVDDMVFCSSDCLRYYFSRLGNFGMPYTNLSFEQIFRTLNNQFESLGFPNLDDLDVTIKEKNKIDQLKRDDNKKITRRKPNGKS